MRKSFVAIWRAPSEHPDTNTEDSGVCVLMSCATNRPKSARRTVLCVDDNYDVLRLEKSILEKADYAVVLASNGIEGLNLVRGGEVDLIVLDLEMPNMTGVELAQRIRVIQPTIPIIMVSAAGPPQDLAGIVDCFVPKIQMTTLVREVSRLLRDT